MSLQQKIFVLLARVYRYCEVKFCFVDLSSRLIICSTNSLLFTMLKVTNGIILEIFTQHEIYYNYHIIV